jgi:6-pyruvoyl-tetrahydropterin synthase
VVNIFQNAYRGARQILFIQSCCEKILLQFSHSYQWVCKLHLVSIINDLIESSFDKTVLIFLKAAFNCTYGTVQVICQVLFIHLW